MVGVFSAIRSVEKKELWTFLWLLSIIWSTLFSSYWDIVRDWGLGDPQFGFLRKKLLYRKPPVKFSNFDFKLYYAAIGVNIFLRLMWTLTISPESIGIVMEVIFLR